MKSLSAVKLPRMGSKLGLAITIITTMIIVLPPWSIVIIRVILMWHTCSALSRLSFSIGLATWIGLKLGKKLLETGEKKTKKHPKLGSAKWERLKGRNGNLLKIFADFCRDLQGKWFGAAENRRKPQKVSPSKRCP